MIEIRYFPDTWEEYEEKCLLFLHSGRERLSNYLQQILNSKDLDSANFYQRYINIYEKWSSMILSSKHPLQTLFEKENSYKTESNQQYLNNWKEYINSQILSFEMEIRLINYNLTGKMARYRPPISRTPFPD